MVFTKAVKACTTVYMYGRQAIYFSFCHDILHISSFWDKPTVKYNKERLQNMITRYSIQDTFKTVIRPSSLVVYHHYCNIIKLQLFRAVLSTSSHFQPVLAISSHFQPFQVIPAISCYSQPVLVINRPGVAGAVLHSPPSLGYWPFSSNIFQALSIPNRKS